MHRRDRESTGSTRGTASRASRNSPLNPTAPGRTSSSPYPPFNIGYKYDVYEDRKAYDDYHAWTEAWMRACSDVLAPTGSFRVAIGAEYAAEVRMIGRALDLTLRNWVIWHYTFGQNTKAKFGRAHVHLFYFVKDPREFTFNDEAVRTFSDRERVYRDKRANPKGRIPDDVWTEFPRVCGTFGEREGWHPCQMPPEPLLARIVRSCSNVGDLVCDPFAGSGTTVVAAKRLNRNYLGFELSEDYVTNIRKRLAETTPFAKAREDQQRLWPAAHVELLKEAYADFTLSTDSLHRTPHLFARFVERFNLRLRHSGVDDEYAPDAVWRQLERLRKEIKTPQDPRPRRRARRPRTPGPRAPTTRSSSDPQACPLQRACAPRPRPPSHRQRTCTPSDATRLRAWTSWAVVGGVNPSSDAGKPRRDRFSAPRGW